MSFLNLRIGNLVEYIGPLSGYNHRIGEIISIDKMNDTDTFLLRISNYRGEQNEIRAYKNGISPIHLSVSQLTILGFQKEEARNVFSLNGINIIRPAFVKTNETGHSLIDKGFVIVEKQISYPPSEEEVETNTTSIPYLHSFQNYYQDRYNQTINTTDFT